jgi:hypothetical protein
MTTTTKLSISVDKYSGDNSVNPNMFIQEIDTWIAVNGVTANQQQVMALHLTGAAKEWYYNEFAKLPATDQTYDKLKEKLRARFSRGDDNIIARREQYTLRIVRTNPPNFLVSVSTFNAAFTRNQVKIKDQGQVDQVMAYMECIRLSIPDYPEVLQLQQSLDNTFTILADNDKTLSKAQEIVAQRAPNIIDAPSNTQSLHNISYNNNSNNYRNNRYGAGGKRQRPVDHRMSYAEARRLKICTYCRDPHATHRQVRQLNPSTGRFDGGIVCPVLLADIQSGKVKEQQPTSSYARRNNYHLNASDSRTTVTNSAVNNQ